MNNEEKKIRVLLTKSQMDGHDRGIRYVAGKLREAGMDVIFTTYAVAEEIVNIATEEDVDVNRHRLQRRRLHERHLTGCEATQRA